MCDSNRKCVTATESLEEITSALFLNSLNVSTVTVKNYIHFLMVFYAAFNQRNALSQKV